MNLLSKMPLKILSFLCRNPSASMYEREISRRAKVSIGATNQVLRKLLSMKIVSRRRRGRMYFYTLNTDNPVVKQFKVFLNVYELKPLLDNITKISRKIILFGSCAEGSDTEFSDVDLLVLTEDPQVASAEMEVLMGKYKRKLSPVVVNSSKWLEMKKKDRPFYNRVNAGIVLWRKKE